MKFPADVARLRVRSFARTAARAASLVVLSIAAATCRDDAIPTAVEESPPDPSFLIQDAAHSDGREHFYFLPPMVPQPTTSGAFDANLQPVVEICVLVDEECGEVIARFTREPQSTPAGSPGDEEDQDDDDDDEDDGEQDERRRHTDRVRLHERHGHYIVKWRTDRRELNPELTYRIRVLVDGIELGLADVDVVGNRRDLRNVNTNEFIPLMNGRTLKILFRIETAFVARIDVAPNPASVIETLTQQFTAVKYDLHGGVLPGPVIWASANDTIATIDQSGLATGVADGIVDVTASAAGAVGSASLDVSRVVRIDVQPVDPEAEPGGQQQFVATVYDENDIVIAEAPVTWSSSDESVATVDQTGLVTIVGGGVALIQAEVVGVSGSTSTDGNVSISVPPGALTTPLDITMQSVTLDPSEYADGALVPGTTYDFGPDGSVFNEPGIRVVIGYDPANLGTIPEGELTLLTQIDSSWAEVPTSVVDVSANTVTADLAHFTLVTVGALQPANIVEPGPIDMVTGQMLELNGVVGFHRSNRWTTSASGIVSVVTNLGPDGGRVRAVAPGTATIYLTSVDPGYPWVTVTRQDSVTINVSPPGDGTLINLTGGFNFTCGQDPSGVAYCWGQNTFGQLGDRTLTNRSAPVPVAGNLQYTKLVAGGAHACGLTSDGRAWCWGRNNFGQLGDGTLVDHAAPVTVMGDRRFDLLTAGDRHTCGFTRLTPTHNPMLMCWGSNEWGQSGGSIGGAPRTQPTSLLVNPGVMTSLDAGLGHTCATLNSSTSCWGLNGNGQLGDGTTVNRAFHLTPVSSPETFRSVSAGPAHTCAITTDGRAFCWGRNAVPGVTPATGGQLGDGTTDERRVPTAVIGPVSTWQSIDAGGNAGTTCGISADLSAPGLYCWGRNLAGNVGDASNIDRFIPTLVAGGHTFVQVTASGGGHTCAARAGGGGYCWGSNAFGQVGNNPPANTNVPAPVAVFTEAAGQLPGSFQGTIRQQFTTIPLHTVRVSPTYGLPALTDAQGFYQLGPMIPGPNLMRLDFLPAGCTDPGVNLPVLSGTIQSLSIQVPCFEIASVTIAPATATVQMGTILTPLVTVRATTGQVINVPVTYGSTGPLSVSATGQITATGAGQGTVTALAAPASGLANIAVQGGCGAVPATGCVLTAHAPALEPFMRSVGAPAPTTIQFTNASSAPIQVWWLDFTGTRQLFTPPIVGLASNASVTFNTFTTHTWVVTDLAGNALGVYLNPTTVLARAVHGDGGLASFAQVQATAFPMSSVWGSSAANVWAFGFGADPYRHQVSGWAVESTELTFPRPMNDLWGSATTNVFAVGWDGRIIHWNGSAWSLQASGTPNRLEAVAGAGSKVFAVGTGGVIVTKDGAAPWAVEPASPTTVQLNDVWAADANNAWAVGDGGVVLHYNGVGWTSTPPNPLETRSFRSVWGTSATDVYAVGEGGMIYHFDGTWSAETSNTTQTLQAVAGTSMSQVVAGGGQGTYLRRNTTGPIPQWIPQPIPSSETLQGIWFASPTDAVIVTSNATTIPQTGTILRGTP